MSNFFKSSFIALSGFLAAPSSALEIVFRYDLDTEGFFEQEGAIEALETAAEFFENLIVDELEAIDPTNFQPGTQFSWQPTYREPNQSNQELPAIDETDLLVPADTLIIFVGGRRISALAQGGPGGIEFLPPANTAWFNQLISRGEAGATQFINNSFTTGQTDFAPWGGTMFFNSNVTWNFSTTDPIANSGIDFLSVAFHELGHILGLGILSPTSSWQTLIENGRFQGALASESNQNTAPQLPDLIHWATFLPDSRTLPVAGRQHGEAQHGMMRILNSALAADQFAVPTDLDIAALRDIGWELELSSVTPLEPGLNFGPSSPQLTIPTTTGINYQVMRSESLDSFTPLGPLIIGNGAVQTWDDPNGLIERAFYTIVSRETVSPVSASHLSPKNLPETALSLIANWPSLPAIQCQCGKH